jgi:hypothetical protein
MIQNELLVAASEYVRNKKKAEIESGGDVSP